MQYLDTYFCIEIYRMCVGQSRLGFPIFMVFDVKSCFIGNRSSYRLYAQVLVGTSTLTCRTEFFFGKFNYRVISYVKGKSNAYAWFEAMFHGLFQGLKSSTNSKLAFHGMPVRSFVGRFCSF